MRHFGNVQKGGKDAGDHMLAIAFFLGLIVLASYTGKEY